MSLKKFAAIAGVTAAVLSTVLLLVNGWHANNGVMYIVASVLIVGAGVAWYAEQGD